MTPPPRPSPPRNRRKQKSRPRPRPKSKPSRPRRWNKRWPTAFYRRSNTSTPNFASLGFGTAGNNNGFNEDYSIFERLARVSSSALAPDSTFPNLQRAVSRDFTIEPALETASRPRTS